MWIPSFFLNQLKVQDSWLIKKENNKYLIKSFNPVLIKKFRSVRDIILLNDKKLIKKIF